MNQKIISRFAPSPTGNLHLGHIYSALKAFNFTQKHKGEFIIRMEDIDTGRCRDVFKASIIDDLSWFGITSDQPVRYQSQHFDDYQEALEILRAKELVYPCFCTRQDIAREIEASPSAPHGPDGPIYPGTCKELTKVEREEKKESIGSWAYRLNVSKALDACPPLYWHDHDKGKITAEPLIFGDVVIARKDTPTSYHLSVVVDDNIQNISHIIRGEDLFHATHVHRLLQELLGLNVPQYCHHPLLTDDQGKRFAKRDHAVTIKELREKGCSPEELINIIRAREPSF